MKQSEALLVNNKCMEQKTKAEIIEEVYLKKLAELENEQEQVLKTFLIAIEKIKIDHIIKQLHLND